MASLSPTDENRDQAIADMDNNGASAAPVEATGSNQTSLLSASPVQATEANQASLLSASPVQATESNQTLLREWRYPPVAPAVVVGEEVVAGEATTVAEATASPNNASELHSEAHTAAAAASASPSAAASPAERLLENLQLDSFQLPVATFVRDVREQITFVRDQISQNLQYPDAEESVSTHGGHQQRQQHSNDNDEAILPLSVRSEADAARLGEELAAAAAMGQQEGLHQTVSARTVNDIMANEEAEFILVDGDLIALPPRQMEGEDDNESSLLDQNHQPKACRPSRMRRGVRKLSKMFGRNKKKGQAQQNQTGSSADSCNTTLSDLPPINPNAPLPPVTLAMSSDHESRSLARQSSLGDQSGQSLSPGRATTNSNAANSNKRQNRPRLFGRGRANSRDVIRNEEAGLEPNIEPARQRADTDSSHIYLNDDNGQSDTGLFSGEQINQLRAPPFVSELMSPIQETSGGGRIESATATPVGTEIQVLEQQVAAGLTPPPSAEAFIEYEFYDDEKYKKDDIPASLVPVDADIKVDKADAPDVETMLLRAAHETTTDLDHHEFEHSSAPKHHGKSDGESVPLSQAKRTDKLVHNDMLKVVLVGSVGNEKSALARAIRESHKRPKKRTTLGLDVHTWSDQGVNFHLWDVQGATMPSGWSSDTVPNFGAHPATQSLFFSAESLYLLVWDLACHNPHAHPVLDYDSDEDDEYANEYAREQAIAEADRALHEDISNRVLAWVDRIARRAPKSAILPVACIPDGMDENEVQRRCTKMFEMLENHMKWYEGNGLMPNIILDDSRNVLCVNFSQHFGIKQIQDTMVAISESSVFEHVGTPVPPGTVEVLAYTKRVKKEHKLIRLEHIVGELSDYMTMDQVVVALRFLSNIGEILYFGMEGDEVLSSFVILSRQWLVSALSCILRNELKREIADARRFMNMQCIYSEEQFKENEVIRALSNGAASNCPLLSDEDAKMLWQSMSFMREAADQYSQLNENSTSAPTMFYFLEHLLVHFGVFLPFGNLNQNQVAGLNRPSECFFVPSLLSQADPGDIWGFRSSEAWTTTLCHSWLFRDGAPSDLFEHVAVALLRDMYLFSREFSTTVPRDQPTRASTTPLGRASQHQFAEEHSSQKVGPVRIHQVICWKSAMLLKIGTIFPDRESDELRESIVEVFVTIVDQNSSYCVSADAMRGSMQRVIVSGKGQSGLNGLKLFKGGYQAVLDSVQSSLASFNNVNMQIICPECLSRGNPRRASTWGWDECYAAAEGSESTIVCRRGHRVKSGLLVGSCKEEPLVLPTDVPTKPVPEILQSVFLIGLWDPGSQQLRSVGSGFVVDKKLGLVATAGHVLFNMEEGSPQYGTPYLGIKDAKVVIGVIPDKDKKNAVWRYFAEILADDVRNDVDACILRITHRMESDVDDDSPGSQTERMIPPLDPGAMKKENLNKLKLELNLELEQSVRILGFSQGDAKEEPNSRRRIIRSPDFDRGYVVRMFSANLSDSDDSSSSDSESRLTFNPREEVVVRCPTIIGHSGGPCVNDDGAVIGILSRADPTDRHRCFLVPAGQVRQLVRRAKGLCSRPMYASASTELPSRYNSV